jgi:hypothetical protein
MIPPLTGVAVKFTVVPAHTFTASERISTLTGSTGLMITVVVASIEEHPLVTGVV